MLPFLNLILNYFEVNSKERKFTLNSLLIVCNQSYILLITCILHSLLFNRDKNSLTSIIVVSRELFLLILFFNRQRFKLI